MSIFLVAAVGFAIDGSALYGHRQMAQAAADAAAQSGILSIFHGTNSTASSPFATGTTPTPYTCTTTDNTTPCVYARYNGFGGADDTVSISFPTTVPGVTLAAGNASALTVRVQRSVNATLMAILGLRSFTVAATATAALAKFPMTNCITALDTTAGDAFSVLGNANINLTTCGIAVNSSNSSSALHLNGNISLAATNINVVGGASKQGNVSISPTPTTGVPAISDPLASVPAPSYPPTPCGSYTAGVPLNPGTYCGGLTFSGNANVTFRPGTYILLGGGLNASGNVTLTGSNVSFYNTYDASHPYSPISLSGNINLNLSAPSSGSLSGMLFFEDRTAPLGRTQSLTGNSGSNLTGALYFPRSELEYRGNSSTGIQNIAIVANTVSLVGNASLKSDPSVAGAAQQIKVALVQ